MAFAHGIVPTQGSPRPMALPADRRARLFKWSMPVRTHSARQNRHRPCAAGLRPGAAWLLPARAGDGWSNPPVRNARLAAARRSV